MAKVADPHHGIEPAAGAARRPRDRCRLRARRGDGAGSPRRRRAACSGCGQVYRAAYDRALWRWRHLDAGGRCCFVEYRLRRLECRDCGVRVEAVSWARPGARHTRDVEDLLAFLAQQMFRTAICALLQVGWDTVGAIVARVVADHLDERRLAGLVAVGVGEISYRRRAALPDAGRRPRHEHHRVVPAEPQRLVAFDPFHVVRLAGDAVDAVRRAEWNAHGKSNTTAGRWVKHARWSLLTAPERQTTEQLARPGEVQHTNRRLYRAFLLYDELRLLYRLDDPGLAPARLKAWLAWGRDRARSPCPPRPPAARPPRRHPRRRAESLSEEDAVA